jgi:hypothetical protein
MFEILPKEGLSKVGVSWQENTGFMAGKQKFQGRKVCAPEKQEKRAVLTARCIGK